MRTFYKEPRVIYGEMTSTYEHDVSEGSLIHLALMPTANQLSYNSLVADELEKKLSTQDCLEYGYYDLFIKKCNEEGITQKEATTATGMVKITGTPGSQLPAGSIVSTVVGIQYTTNANVTINNDGFAYVNITAKEEGSRCNCNVGDISVLPVRYVGILGVTNESEINNGYDEESYEDMYARYLVKVQAPPTSGNKAHYKQWCLECTGVGNAIVIPRWDVSNGRNGRGTVKCVISDSNRQGASDELIQTVKNYIDPYPEGYGNGQAPIGCVVTVVSAQEIPLNIDCKLSYNSTLHTEEHIKELITESINNYLKDVAFEIRNVRVSKINAIIMSLSEIEDCQDLTVNGEPHRISIADEDIPVMGTITFSMIEGD